MSAPTPAQADRPPRGSSKVAKPNLLESAAVQPFCIAVDDAVLADLRRRLQQTRWPEAELVDGWSQGVPRAWLQDICRYWADGYDLRAREARLKACIYSRGDSVEPGAAYRAFRGRDAQIEPMLRERGLLAS